MKNLCCQIKNEKNLLKLAKIIINNLDDIRLIALHGNLGSGKTTFTKFLGQALGIKQKITSPSFVLTKFYELPRKKNNIKYLCHADFYRTKNADLSDLKDYLENPEILVVIEWPERIKKLPAPRVDIKIKINSDNSRLFTVCPKI